MIQTRYVSFEEFNAFKKMTEQKLRETDNKIDALTEIMISSFDRAREQSDKKFEELTDIMMKGFERSDMKFAELREEMNGFDAFDEKFERRFIETDEKLENITELMMDGFDMLRDKIEEHKN